MSEKKSFYENEYTRQMEEAVSSQKIYDDKRFAAKEKAKAEKQRQVTLTRLLYFLVLLFAALGGLRISQANSEATPIIVIFLALVAGVWLFSRWINK